MQRRRPPAEEASCRGGLLQKRRPPQEEAHSCFKSPSFVEACINAAIDCAVSGGGSGSGGDGGNAEDPGGSRDVRPVVADDADRDEDDFVDKDIMLRHHRIARCVSKMSVSLFEEGCMQTSRTILHYDSMFHTPLLSRRVVHIS